MKLIYISTVLLIASCKPAIAEEDLIDRIAVEEEIKLIKLHEVNADGSYKHKRPKPPVEAIDGFTDSIEISYIQMPVKLRVFK